MNEASIPEKDAQKYVQQLEELGIDKYNYNQMYMLQDTDISFMNNTHRQQTLEKIQRWKQEWMMKWMMRANIPKEDAQKYMHELEKLEINEYNDMYKLEDTDISFMNDTHRQRTLEKIQSWKQAKTHALMMKWMTKDNIIPEVDAQNYIGQLVAIGINGTNDMYNLRDTDISFMNEAHKTWTLKKIHEDKQSMLERNKFARSWRTKMQERKAQKEARMNSTESRRSTLEDNTA